MAAGRRVPRVVTRGGSVAPFRVTATPQLQRVRANPAARNQAPPRLQQDLLLSRRFRCTYMMLDAITALLSLPLVISHRFRRSRITVTRNR